MDVPRIRFLLPGGASAVATPGAIVGRMPGAAVRVVDPQVSEAHALVSLRGRSLRLLALRGALVVDGHPEDDVTLAPGQRIVLAGDLALQVAEVTLPETVLAVHVGEEPPRELCASVYSLLADGELVARYEPDGLAWLWSGGEGWSWQPKGERPTSAREGAAWEIGGTIVRIGKLPIERLGAAATVTDRPRVLTLVARHTSTWILREGRAPVVVDALPGRLLSEMALLGGPIGWEEVAREIWPDADAMALRKSWDRALARLRERLREEGLRDDLVRPDGKGNVELFLLPGERVVDEA